MRGMYTKNKNQEIMRMKKQMKIEKDNKYKNMCKYDELMNLIAEKDSEWMY